MVTDTRTSCCPTSNAPAPRPGRLSFTGCSGVVSRICLDNKSEEPISGVLAFVKIQLFEIEIQFCFVSLRWISWGCKGQLAMRRPTPRFISIPRSDSDRPPQMPYGSATASACSRH